MGGRVTSSIAKAWLWCRVQTTEAQTGVRWRVTCGILPQAAWHVSWFNIDYRNAAHYQPTKRAHVTNTQKARSAEASFRGGGWGIYEPSQGFMISFFSLWCAAFTASFWCQLWLVHVTGQIETLAVHYRVLVDDLLVYSQTVSADAYFRAKFPDGKCEWTTFWQI